MKDLKFLLVTEYANEIANSLFNELNNFGFAKLLETSNCSKIINFIIRSKIDVVFLDVDYLGIDQANKVCHLIESITGKVCLYVNNENSNHSMLFSKYGFVNYNILKIDLLTLLVDSLNKFNNNTILRKEKCYDFIYIVWEDLRINMIEIEFIREVSKEENAIYLFYDDKKIEKRVINISFEKFYKLLNKNFEKSRLKITNKIWTKKRTQNEVFLLRKSA